MNDLETEMERSWYQVVTDRAIFSSANAKVHRISSNIDGVRERSKGYNTNKRDAVDWDKDTEERERAKDERLHNIL